MHRSAPESLRRRRSISRHRGYPPAERLDGVRNGGRQVGTTARQGGNGAGSRWIDRGRGARRDGRRGRGARLKDTVRVNPNEIVEIAVRFTTYSGRYMYHCHILEHEDRDMMRPFVTMPPELMPFMA